ncbi:hypothetical protein FB567DRAFT_446364 [Paraphoma chrysanthemicola]|uniref:NmrA-like domain-containing protein n=1 Tax=Paraphoma chrysanthemicola TaxID=798071 RepID=A0A8K0VXD6_9PLEO|nr:hypothetical protein FB567DRAFT_446364 [Paraphoma chrysanthemicola]
MVKIAIAGGSGNVAQEIIDGLVATKKHEILLFTRKDPPPSDPSSAVTWAKTDYLDVKQLTSLLAGTHTVFSFVAPYLDQEEAFNAQKNLIDASIQAGVKRFAPSEWASANFAHLSWYTYKAKTREYLSAINKDAKVLEYCLFQPGLFTNYLTWPHSSAKHVKSLDTPWDYGNRRILQREGGEEDIITLTTVDDLVNVVVRAVEFDGEWPTNGGIRGTQLTMAELVALGEKIRGGKFTVEDFKSEDLESGSFKPSWLPKLEHPSIAPEHVDAASKMIVQGFLLAFPEKAFDIGDQWNKILPNYKFTGAEEFLTEAWKGKP